MKKSPISHSKTNAKNIKNVDKCKAKSIALRLFNDDIKDMELSNNFKNFLDQYESSRKRKTDFENKLNELLKRQKRLENIILALLTEKLDTTQSLSVLKCVNIDISKVQLDISFEQENVNKLGNLIHSYKKSSEEKLFFHWKNLTAHGDIKDGWQHFKEKYKDVII